MPAGLLPNDRYYYHESRPSSPLWAKCEQTLLREQSKDAVAFRKRGLAPCPRCWPAAEARPA